MKKLYLLTCSYFIREMKLALPAEYEQDIEVIAFPSHCGRPQLSWDDIARMVPAKESGAEAIIFGNTCIAGSELPPPELSHCRKFHLQQCFHLLCPPKIVDSTIMEGAYLLSPGWLASWSRQLKEWGFDQNGSRAFMKESVNRLLLLDTGVDQAVDEKLQSFSDYINLPKERLSIGLDYLKLLLQHEISAWKIGQLKRQHQDEQMQISNYAMSLDLIATLTQSTSEVEVIDGVFELFTMLVAPDEMIFFPINAGVIKQPKYADFMSTTEKEAHIELPEMKENYLWTESGNGFWLRLQHRNEIMGLLKIEQFAMPQYKDAYLNLSLNIIDVCALVIDNARILKQLVDSAHLAGKAEVAIDVLHNVGNVLNSINISTEVVTQKVQNSVGRRLSNVALLLSEHQEQLVDFMTNDSRGEKLPAFFSLLATELEKERNTLLDELKRLSRHLEHVKTIIRTQQVYSRSSDLLERSSFEEIFEEALQLYDSRIARYHIKIIREFTPIGVMNLQKQKLLQIIINLISNAIDSLSLTEGKERQIILRLMQQEKRIVIEVVDNGIGIINSDIEHIFNHGFTTKASHSGYGLHSIANLATEMKGHLSVSSGGMGQGACFKFDCPLIEHEVELDANS